MEQQIDKIKSLEELIEKQKAMISARNEELRVAQKEAEYYRGITEGYRRAFEIVARTGGSHNE